MKTSITFFFFLLITTYSLQGQNLPSLLNEKNINATFSILAYDEEAKEWGIAVATNNICVGNSTVYIEPGLGAFSVIAETAPMYASKGFEHLKNGKTIKEAITEVKQQDSQANYRQVSGIDAKGEAFAFTGKSLKYWNGDASQLIGKQYVVMGNQLADGVLLAMSTAFENAGGTLAERLLQSLEAGQKAGGQLSGKQSAAVVVKGTENEWYNQIDLRVDHAKHPIQELRVLMNYHYGRIRLNQAFYAQRAGNLKLAKQRLEKAEKMLEGWNGMYSKIALAYVLMGDKATAVKWIKKGLAENPNWKVNLPAFYFLRDQPDLASMITPETFSTKDWENAIMMLSNLGREIEIIELGKHLKAKKIESSYLNFLIGRSYFYEKEQNKAIKYLERALEMDQDNIEAVYLLKKIKGGNR